MSKKPAGKPPRFKVQRRLQVELPGLGKAGALDKRPYPPGQHGNQRRKLSEYALRLEEKQKLLTHYDLREEQLRRFVRQAKAGQVTDWVDTLIGMLERRVDNVVFRLGFAPSLRSARQMVLHGKVLVNGKKLTIGSAVLKVGSQVKLIPAAYQSVSYMQAQKTPRLEMADWLETSESANEKIGKIKEVPRAFHIPFPFETGLVAEYYAARKA
jgi:small subunit ribosomal protein S4